MSVDIIEDHESVTSIKDEINSNEGNELDKIKEEILTEDDSVPVYLDGEDYDNVSIKDEMDCNKIEEEIENENLICKLTGYASDKNQYVLETFLCESKVYSKLEGDSKPQKGDFHSTESINAETNDSSSPVIDLYCTMESENQQSTDVSGEDSILLKGFLSKYKENKTEIEDCEDSKEFREESGPSLEITDVNDDITDVLPQKFQVDISVIESVSKENQASELQNLEGLSVYDQATLEAGILRQVDQALEQDLDAPCRAETAVLLEPGEDETDMERKIRLGEMTPFGTTLNMTATPTITHVDGLSEIEKYLQKQLELQGKRKIQSSKPKKGIIDSTKNSKSVKLKETGRDHLKKKIFSRDEKKKKKKRKKGLGTESEDISWTEKADPEVGEITHVYPEESGSEYLPSESDYIPSSDDEKKVNHKIRDENIGKGRKRKLKNEKPYKLPEDWASEDSDWEYSDEEGNMKKNKRSKKELDDGDVDMFNCRIRQWERENKKNGNDEETLQYHHFDGDYKLPLAMWNKLYNYQRVGVQWLWELDRQRCGGVLGDEMGLGKTIQIIAFLAGLHISKLKDKDTNYRGLGPSLIVCPTTVMHQWVKEFHTWYPPLRVAILHESGTFCGKQRSRLISNMAQVSGVLITSYTGATQHKDDILTRHWHYVILDEGHKIRNPDAQITLMVKQLRTSHRIILSGSPMQNNLKELWSLFDFVFPGKLGTLPVFLEQFAVPITQGGYANASQVQVMTAFKCATVLKDTIAPYLLRRMKADVKSHVNLPEKNEQVLFCRLTDEQRDYYKGYVESGEVSRILDGRLKIFMGLINLRKICNHPDLYSGGSKLYEGETEDKLALEERYGYWKKSGKMIVVETLLKLWKKQCHRVLIFTQSRQMLCIMESFVKQAGYAYLKLDGGTSIAARQPLINKFNQDTSYFVMLLTTRVGGLGVNLTGANRVLIYDPDWNPATDTQARERAWRIGQKQSVTVYRLITAGTIEEKMYHRQIFKQFLCNKVLKDPRQRRFFKSNDLYELFTLKETDVEGSTETAAIFAGTDSEVKLDQTKTYKHRKVEPRSIAEAPTVTFSRKRAEEKKRLNEKIKKDSDHRYNIQRSEINFSDEKREQMKKLAQILSKKCVKSPSAINNDQASTSNNIGLNSTEKRGEIVLTDGNSPCTQNEAIHFSTPSTSRFSGSIGREQKKKHKVKNKKKRHKDAKFEGEPVPHLVKTGVSTTGREEENANDGNYATQDDYVLQKLFEKSGLQTAMKHDTIMEGGPADYALVEGEADRVAKQAVEKLRESRRECWRPTTGVPNFTGINGARNFQSKPRFGNTKSSVGGMSSKELLEQIRKRNGTVDAKDTELALVQNIRDFVSSNGGTVNTNQLIERFEGKLAEGSSPLFKSFLSKICTFYRAPDRLGYWTLKQDFVW